MLDLRRALALGAVTALAASASASAATGPSVSGGGENNPVRGDVAHFAINAKSNAGGQAFGQIHFIRTVNAPEVDGAFGDVICVRAVDTNPFLPGGEVAT